MKQELDNFINIDGIIEIQNRERSACKILSVEFVNKSTILNFDNIFPVRELNFAETPNWKIDLYRISFGKKFSFVVKGKIEVLNENEIRFIENDRGLTVSINFTKSIVKETMLKYIDALIPPIK
jgi:hypothetical protein